MVRAKSRFNGNPPTQTNISIGKATTRKNTKKSVVRTLLNRAENLVTEQEDKHQETSHIKKVLRANGNKPCTFKSPEKKNKDEPENTNIEHGENKTTKKHPVRLPYTKGLSEELQRIFKSHGVPTPTYHKPSCTLRQMVVHPKDKNKKEQQFGVVYEITCEDCKEKYVGDSQNARTLGSRLKERTAVKGQVTSAIAEHSHFVKIYGSLWKQKFQNATPTDFLSDLSHFMINKVSHEETILQLFGDLPKIKKIMAL